MSAGKDAHFKCSVCNKYFDKDKNEVNESDLTIAIDQTAHAYGAWASDGNGKHTRVCALNAEHKETQNCSGGTATCTAKAKCSACNAEYGALTEHTYTEASCTAKAKCTVCNIETGVLADHKDENSDGKCDACEHQMTSSEPEKPEENEPKGLSGGAIAGIVVGSVSVAGIGGFSLFWFVIKKKKLSDLIQVLKAIKLPKFKK